jgi:hypothetical protein
MNLLALVDSVINARFTHALTASVVEPPDAGGAHREASFSTLSVRHALSLKNNSAIQENHAVFVVLNFLIRLI